MAHRLARLFAPASSCLAKGGAAAAASAAAPGATTTTAAGLSGLLASEGAATAGARRFFQSSRAAAAEARPSAPEVHGSGNFVRYMIIGGALGGGAFAYTLFSSRLPAPGTLPRPGETKQATPAGKPDYGLVRQAIAEAMEAPTNYDDGSYGPLLVRLAWHASGTYDKASNTGGSNGATMRFASEANAGGNAGLKLARDLLEPLKQKFPGISYADLWTLAGCVAIEEMGGPHIPWRAGRTDEVDASKAHDGSLLPDGDKGAAHVRDVFTRMGFNDQEAVALCGAHCMGRCHTDRSGFSGPWTNAPTTFSNLYFKELLERKWQKKKWSGPLQYEDKESKALMMLNTDMALLWDKGLRKWTELYAKDEDKFASDFAAAFAKLLELGVPFPAGAQAA